MIIGFVGLGAMGSPMAARLVQAGYAVRGFDINPASVARLAEAGGTPAVSAAEAATGADVLMLMVVNLAQAEAVLDGGALAALPAGGIVVLMATCPAAGVEALAARVTGAGRRFLDAPVSGGVAGAQSGGLTIMAAGDNDTFAAAEPALRVMGSRLFRVGERPGQGAVAKTVNQLLCGVHLAAAAEALALAERLELDMGPMLDIVSGSAASSWMLRDRGPRMIEDTGAVTSAVDIFVKDLGIVADTGRHAGQPLPLAAAALQMFLAASGRGEGALDDSQVIRSYRVLSGGRRG
jgi:3-hydroxyisobutyrate dehydrogenase